MRKAAIASLLMLWPLSACSAGEEALPPAYRDLEVPKERLLSSEARSRGRELFLEHCALCHGKRADGRGLRRASLSGPPADFTRPDWAARNEPRRIYYIIHAGIRGTSMPAWKILDRDETWDVVAYLLSVSKGGAPAAGREAG